MSFRANPFGGGYTIAAGLEEAVRVLESLHFTRDDLDYLATVPGNDNQRLFPDDFLRPLETFQLSCDIDAIPEGTIVFPQEPLIRVTGPILEAQIIETALLNMINFQSLIATKAARVVYAAKGYAVIEFGLRRAQGANGRAAAPRAGYCGGWGGDPSAVAGRGFQS